MGADFKAKDEKGEDSMKSLKLTLIGLGVLCLFLIHPSAWSFVYTATDTPLGIWDYNTTTSTINVTDNESITDLNVFVNLTHTFMADLDIYLIHGATTIQLFDQYGGGGDNLTNVLFDDEASSYIYSVGAPFGPGLFKPGVGLLSSFDGMDIFGNWTLSIYDNYGIDSGTLYTFRIEGNAVPSVIPEPATILLLSSGLLGLGGLRFRKNRG